MGGLGNVSCTPVQIGSQSWPGVTVWTDHPAVSCMASQYAGWAVSVGKFFAMGSGPLRAHARVERELFEKLGYQEQTDAGVLVLEEGVAHRQGGRLGCGEGRPAAPSADLRRGAHRHLAGGVQISARIVETGLHKIETLGFDVNRIVSATGTAPLPPVAKNDLRAIGRTNDCILYGGQARYTVKAGDAELEKLAEQVPASASRRLRHAVLRNFPAVRRRLLQDRSTALQPGRGVAHQHRDGRTFHAGSTEP